MDRVTETSTPELIRLAESAGLTLSIREGKLRIDGPRSAEAVAQALLSRAAEVRRVLSEREARRINPYDDSLRIGCPYTRPLVRGPELPAAFVSSTAIPNAAVEYHAHGNTWLLIPRHWVSE